MKKTNIIIAIAVIAVVMAVVLIPRLLGGDGGAEPQSEPASRSEAETGSVEPQQNDIVQQQNTTPADPEQHASNPALEAQLAEAVRQVNAAEPIVIDEMTRVTAASSQGIRMQYRYELSRELDANQVRQFQQIATTQNQRTICARPETREMIDLGGEIEYAYYGPGDRFLFSIPIVGC